MSAAVDVPKIRVRLIGFPKKNSEKQTAMDNLDSNYQTA